jgi:diguanylate cyclase (GGDEF)-like protein
MPSTTDFGSPRSVTARANALVGVCVLSIAAMPLLGRDRMHVPLVACVATGLVVFVHSRLGTGSLRPSFGSVASPWVAALASQAFLAVDAVRDVPRQVVALRVLAAAALFLAGAVALVAKRLRAAAIELVIESSISTAGLALLAYCLVLDPLANEPGVQADAVIAFFAVVLSVAALVMYGWLLSVDPEAKGTATGMFAFCGLSVLASGVVALCGVLAVPVDPRLRVALVIIGLCGLFASAAHPDHRVFANPALTVESNRIGHRAVMAMTAVVVGPILVTLSLLTDLSISLAVTAMGSSLLSVAVCAHVFRLLRRWGALEHEVHHDGLTGLPNRAYFNNRLELAVGLARTERRTAAVMFLDLDRFKNVNDSLGHSAGNDLLVLVARRLRSAVDSSVVVARLAGDEFAILIPSVRNYRHTRTIANGILEVFQEPFPVQRRNLYVTPSIGVAHYPTDGVTPSELLEHADAAMYRAKERGRNTVELYTPDHRAQAFNKLDLETALHHAIDNGELQLHYQPKVNLRTGRVCGVEALVRWEHPILGPIPPDEFIPLAEESGLIALIGRWSLVEACRQGRTWLAEGIEGVTVAVNLSPRQFQLQRVQDLVAEVLRATGLPGYLLELEITESLALQDPDGVRAVLDDVHRMGVKCSIDDFGVGYSGLGYLDQFRFDAIKIDRTFVDRIDENGAPIVTAVIAMAKGLEIDVVAEGVETLEQLDFLRRHGCDMMQGYLFSRPLPAEDLGPILRRVLETPRAELVRNLGAALGDHPAATATAERVSADVDAV